ncbi:MAG: hypothetical protein FJX74_11070 [Armatimonadetes bacterium]|nr:hypothetical protein [Armatimonadota bacterium]
MVMILLTALTATFAQDGGASAPRPARVECRGIFGSPESLWKAGGSLTDCDINAVFVNHGELTPELIRRCRREGAKVYAEFGVFAGATTAEKYPELWPLNEKGERQARDDWYLGLCPNVAWYREEQLRLIGEYAATHEIDGLWLDFIRYPGHWEVREPRLEQGCFNEACLEAFSRRAGIELPPGSLERRAEFILADHAAEWTRFKCESIRDFCRDARRVLKAERPNALLGAFVVPWTESDHSDAIHRIVAQDFALLAPELDVLSPMSYHAMCARPVEWIGQFTEYLAKQTGREIWPVVQATEREARYGDAAVDATAFREALWQGTGGGASGVVVFRLADCTADNGKLQVLQDVYGKRAP